MEKLEDAKTKRNGKLWHSYFNRFRQHICSFGKQKVCCCGTEKIAPDEFKSTKVLTPTTERMSVAVEGKFFYIQKSHQRKIERFSTLP